MIILVYFKLGLLKIIRLIILILILFFSIESNVFSNQLINDINEATVFTINEYISDEYGINLAAKVKSQVLIRAWFKWMTDIDYEKHSWLIEEAHKQDALFSGGVTCSSIDKGIFPEEEFLDLTTKDPEGNLYHAFGLPNVNTYHGSLANKKWLDYVLSSAYKQIDAGIDLIFLDEVNGAYRQFEGYDDYGIRVFRELLIQKYCKEKNWKIDDKRWVSLFKIPIDNKDICPDGTIKTFNYPAYLRYYNWTKDPNDRNNPLASFWKEYSEEKDEKAWRYWVNKIRGYAKRKGKKIFICENSVGKEGADFQMVAFMGPFLNCSFDMTFFFNSRINYYREKLKKDIPIVFFHDWGFGGMPWHQLTTEEKINWLRIYVPEIYALGAFFAFPVHGRWGFGNAEENGTLPTIIKLANFFNENSFIYHNKKELNSYEVKLNKKNIRRTFYQKLKSNQKIIHLINHNFINGEFITQDNLIITLKSEKPKEIYAVSPDFEGKKNVKFLTEDSNLKIYVPPFETYCVLVIN